MSEYDSLTSSARLLLLVGHAYLILFPVSPIFYRLCLCHFQQTQLHGRASVQCRDFAYRRFAPLCTFLFFREKQIYQEQSGSPRFLSASLHTCHALFRHRQTLQVLAIIEPFVLASIFRITSPSASIIVTMLYHASGEHLSPCGLYDSLCTLRVSR